MQWVEQEKQSMYWHRNTTTCMNEPLSCITQRLKLNPQAWYTHSPKRHTNFNLKENRHYRARSVNTAFIPKKYNPCVHENWCTANFKIWILTKTNWERSWVTIILYKNWRCFTCTGMNHRPMLNVPYWVCWHSLMTHLLTTKCLTGVE